MAKVYHAQELRNKIFEGVEKLEKVISPNFGPSGRNTVYAQENDIPLVMNSGRKILPQIEPAREAGTLSMRILRDAALETVKEQGDGAAAAVLLAKAMLENGRKFTEAGYSPVAMRKGMAKAADAAADEIKKYGRAVQDRKDIEAIAVSASGDPDIGRLIADVCEKAGPDGAINVEDSQRPETEIRFGGIRYDGGYFSSMFANDFTGRSVHLENPYVMLIDQKIDNIRQIQHVLKEMIGKKSTLLMIVQDMTTEVLNLILTNVKRDVFRVVVAHAPGFGNTRKRNMQALAAKTGAVLIEEYCGYELKDCGLEVCKRVENAVLDKDSTCLKGTPFCDEKRVEILKKRTRELLSQTQDEEVRSEIRETLGILNGDTVIIRAGGTTEPEMFETKQRIESGLAAVRAGVQSGIVPGGGKAFLLGKPAVEKLASQMDPEEEKGAECLLYALQAPVCQIAENAGMSGTHWSPYISSRSTTDIPMRSMGCHFAEREPESSTRPLS